MKKLFFVLLITALFAANAQTATKHFFRTDTLAALNAINHLDASGECAGFFGACSGETCVGPQFSCATPAGSASCVKYGGSCSGSVCSDAAITCINLATSDVCLVADAGTDEQWTYDSTNTAPEDSTTIQPDSLTSGPGRWQKYIDPTINNISDSDAAALIGAGNIALHYHAADRARANHTGTQPVSTISDFDTEVANNSAVAANTAKNSYPSADAAKVAQLSVTQPVDLDTVESNADTAYGHSQAAHAPAAAEQNVQSDWDAVSGDAQILNKPTIPTLTSQLTNDSGLIDTELDPSVNDLGKANLPCNENQIPKVVAGVWSCAADSGTGGGGSWGEITGTLSDQTDLQGALNAKSATSHDHSGTYEPADATILKTADINNAVQAYNSYLTGINQNLSTTDSPTFAGLTINADDGNRAVSLLNNTVTVDCLTGDYRLYPQNGVWTQCNNGIASAFFDGAYGSLSGLPTLGTAADNAEGDFEPAGAITTHSGATDPHGDRAYADGLAPNYEPAGITAADISDLNAAIAAYMTFDRITAIQLAAAPLTSYQVVGYSNSGECIAGVDTPDSDTTTSLSVHSAAITAAGGDPDFLLSWRCIEAGADITMDGETAFIESYAVSGDITVTGGSITMDGESAFVEAYAVSGDITVSGTPIVMDGEVAYVASFAVSGDMTVYGNIEMDGESAFIESYSVSGDITVSGGAPAPATVYAQSDDGFLVGLGGAFSTAETGGAGIYLNISDGSEHTEFLEVSALYSGGTYVVGRSFLTFDIPSTAGTMASVTLKLNSTFREGTSLEIIVSRIADYGALTAVSADFNIAAGTLVKSTATTVGADGNIDVAFDAGQVTVVDGMKGSELYLLIREADYDVGAGSPGTNKIMQFTSTEAGTTTTDPKLYITYE